MEALAVAATTVSPMMPPTNFSQLLSSSPLPVAAKLPKPVSRSHDFQARSRNEFQAHQVFESLPLGRKEKQTISNKGKANVSQPATRPPPLKILPRPNPSLVNAERIPSNSGANISTSDRELLNSRRSPAKPAPGWCDADVKSLKRQEFDFQANLDLFDKEKVFSEMRAQDSINPESRLHAHNTTKSGDSQWRNLRPDENVLGRSVDLLRLDEDNEPKQVNEEDTVLLNVSGRKNVAKPGVDRTKVSPVARQEFSPEIIQKIEQQLVMQGSLSIEQTIEAGARSLVQFLVDNASEMLDSARGQTGRLLFYVSVNRLGAYALCAARYLFNRGVEMDIFISGSLKEAPVYFVHCWRALQAIGVKLTEKLPKQASLLISTVRSVVPVAAPLCALAPCVGARWQIRFGLLNELDQSQKQSNLLVLCDAGWSAVLVNEILQFPSGTYQQVFGLKSYTILSL